MVRIDDRQVGLDDVFLDQRRPGRILIIARAGLRIDRHARGRVLRQRAATGQRRRAHQPRRSGQHSAARYGLPNRLCGHRRSSQGISCGHA